MAPTSFYSSAPVDERWKDDSGGSGLWLRLGLRVLVAMVVLGLLVAVLVTGLRGRSEGPSAQGGWHNVTRQLRAELSGAQDALLQMETQARACNATVTNQRVALANLQSQDLEQRVRIQEMEREITQLKQTLQSAEEELEELRREKASRDSGGGSWWSLFSAADVPGPSGLCMVAALLLLSRLL